MIRDPQPSLVSAADEMITTATLPSQKYAVQMHCTEFVGGLAVRRPATGRRQPSLCRPREKSHDHSALRAPQDFAHCVTSQNSRQVTFMTEGGNRIQSAQEHSRSRQPLTGISSRSYGSDRR
ncbi:hypothetical protein CIHG_03113 [Coccidioides immitis H538.4]|uniref:Uncharacterized protein n=3 Tax=Coccidioides immitis TaxID=5501 RepID=A0A0J8R0G7_COCIT|nr:hypothetical protein CIRG_00809 [Coccidioides immitis RMSCC 2394]KMU78216.1 hypothetical protein CISG_07056 [Coccidioides immitis RMSCC 3703]KMU85329.1 hypothetical protein CIHG_03113 [Coccidioides immitis H538.4]